MNPKRIKLLVVALVTILLVAGCGSRGNNATPTPTKTPGAGIGTVSTPVPTTAETNAGTGALPAAELPPTEPPAATVTENIATVNTDLLNIRAEPNTNAAIQTTAATGEEFVVLAQSADGQWLQLARAGAAVGWASAQFLTVSARQVAAAGDGSAAPSTQPATTQPAASGGAYLPATMSSPDYGAQAFLWWRAEIADRDLDLMREAGFNWVKQSLAWETIEGAGQGTYDWSVADRVVTHVNDKGLKLLARMGMDPDLTQFWAGHPPQNASAFAAYVGAVAQRYNCTAQAVGCIQAFQIWNEPNLAREWGGNRPNPAEYASFLRQAYSAIKAVHPNAIVISAGMAPTGDDNNNAMPDDKFYDQMYQAMGGNSTGYFDMLGVHGAGYASPPEIDPAEVAANQALGGYRFFAFRHVEDIREIMVRYGDTNKQIVLLEFGWTYDRVNPDYQWHGAGAGIDEVVQADYLKRAYIYAAENWSPWIGLMSLLTMPNLDWTNDGNPQDEEQYWWAIMEPSPIDQKYWRPAYIVLCIYFQEELRGGTCIHNPNR